MGPEVEGINPIDDLDSPIKLPIKTIDFGRASIFMKGDIDIAHVVGLADVTAEDEKPIVHVSFSAWEDSGSAASLERQLYIGGATAVANPDSKRIFVFEPYEVRLWEIDEENILPQLVSPGGYFWQVARFYGADRIADKHLSGKYPNESELEVVCKGVERFEDAKSFQFGLSNKADLNVGNLKFDISLNQ